MGARDLNKTSKNKCITQENATKAQHAKTSIFPASPQTPAKLRPRNQPATGLLKINAISTTEDVNDSTGTNLANSTVIWNDSANSNYREEFIAILNAVNQTGQLFGSPRDSGDIGGVKTEVYTISSNQTDLPIFKFQKF